MADKPRKVAIVGTAPSSYPLAPFDDPDWEIWGTSRLYHQIPRWDVWFELHGLDRIGKGWNCDEQSRKKQRDKHIEWLASQTQPVYLKREDERVPAGIAYPLDDVLADLRDNFRSPERYFTNHIAYMLGLAIYERVDEIGVWGVDMALTDEYAYQRPSCEYLIGLARGAGIPVYVPPEADLLKAIHLYGYEDESPFHHKLLARKRELETRRDQAKAQKRQAEGQHAAIKGRLQLMEDLVKANGEIPDMDTLKKLLLQRGKQEAEQLKQVEHQIGQLQANIHGFTGALDNHEYIERSWL